MMTTIKEHLTVTVTVAMFGSFYLFKNRTKQQPEHFRQQQQNYKQQQQYEQQSGGGNQGYGSV